MHGYVGSNLVVRLGIVVAAVVVALVAGQGLEPLCAAPASPVVGHTPKAVARIPVNSSQVTVVSALPALATGAAFREGASAFPTSRLQAKAGFVSVALGREPSWIIDGDTSLSRAVPAINSPFGFHPASIGMGLDRFAAAKEAGIRWHRGLYAYWILIQPTDTDIRNGVFHWEQNDREWGTVPASMEIVANIGLPERLAGWPAQRGRPGVPPGPNSGVRWQLNQPEAAYVAFVKAVVRRYGTTGPDALPGLARPIRYWQVDNEPDLLSSDWEGYARIQEITYRAIKEVCPSAVVLMGGQSGGGIRTFRSFYLPALQKLGGKCVDVYDLHYYGNARLDWKGVEEPYRAIRAELDRLGFARTVIWSTEMGTYSGRLKPMRPPAERVQPGRDGAPSPPMDPPQTEREQARDAVKRHVYSLALGMGRIFWAFGLEEGFKFDGGFFDHTGFIYSGRFQGDPPRGTRKLAFHAYRQMTRLLDGARWSEARLLTPGNHVYAVRIPRGRGTITAAWYDPPYRVRDLLSADALRTARAKLARIGLGPTTQDNLIARFQALADLIMGLAREGGKDAVEPWAPRRKFQELEQKVRSGSDDAPKAVDRFLRKAREELQ